MATMYEVGDVVHVERWPTERPLFALAVLVSLLFWLVLAVTIVGLAYALLLGVVFFLARAAFVAHVRGNGVRLGPEQFPELYAAVVRLSARLGLSRPPEVYIMQAGGALNALATRFLRTEIVILFSDLLEACGDDTAARDMIIAHELGHIRAGHLRRHWLILPALMIPLLGSALSRAREYTCDRFGLAGAGDTTGALRGLAILAAGAKHGPTVNLRAMARQRASLNTGWMTLAEWVASHPPLAKRITALEPALLPGGGSSLRGYASAFAILGFAALPTIVLPVFLAVKLPPVLERLGQGTAAATELGATPTDAVAQVERDIGLLVAFIEAEWGAAGTPPADEGELYDRWEEVNRGIELPLDPFDGFAYGYVSDGTHYVIWSSGPDGESGTDDDIEYDSRIGATGGP